VSTPHEYLGQRSAAEPVPVSSAPPRPGEADGAHWTETAERSNVLALRVMTWLAVHGGRRFARLVLAAVSLYFVLFSGRQRLHSRRYLKRALGRDANWLDGYRHVHTFASTVLDRIYLLRGETTRFELKRTGVEQLDALLAEGRGAFLVGGHIGSFEALGAVGRERDGLRLAMVMYPDNARMINAALEAIAPGQRMTVLPLGRRGSTLAIRDWLDNGGLAGMLGDRTLGADSQRGGLVSVDFLGQPARFSDGPFRLAMLLRRPVMFMVGLYLGGATYDVRFEPLADFSSLPDSLAEREQVLQSAVRAYAARLEALCREQPYNWFNFHDFWEEDRSP